MIKKLDAHDIVQILNNDKFPSHRMFNNDKGQWVQFLMQSLINKNVLIIGRVVAGKLQNFSVTINNKGVVYLLFISDDVITDQEYKKESLVWSKQLKSTGEIKNMKTWDGF